MRKYKIIYADPPWPFKTRSILTTNVPMMDPRNAKRPYPIMEIKEIKALSVASMADEDCALFMWVVAMYIPDALEIAKTWGFKYKTVAFVWEKNVNGKPKPNPGMYTMQSTEFCLLFTKGAMTKYFKNRKVKQLIQAEKRGHSIKPDEARDRIIELFGKLPRLELFARTQTTGWDVFGNQVKNSIKIKGL